MDWLITIVWAGLVGVLTVGLLRAAVAIGKIEALADLPASGDDWPRVSVIVAACDEGLTIEAAGRSLLDIDYPALEIVMVNDRSTDETGAIIDRLAASDDRVIAVHVDELPDGWLGKLNAMQVGTEASTGDYLLYTDADVHFYDDVLRRAVRVCEDRNLGHLALLPRMHGGTFWLNAAISAFATGFLAALQPHKIGVAGTGAYAGVGAFNMVRRADFLRTKGWSFLRMEVVDDTALAMMMVEQAGARAMLGTAGQHLGLSWYESMPAMARGLEKNGFVGLGNCSIARTLAIGIGLPAASAAFVLAPLSGSLFVTGLAAATAALAVIAAVSYRRVGQPFVATLFIPVVMGFIGYVLLRSMVKTLRAGGINWRGTFYSLQALRAGKRLYL